MASIAAASPAILASGGVRRPRQEALRIAVAGVRGRGRNHIAGFNAIDGVDVVALCDPDQKILSELAGKISTVEFVEADVRAILERDDIHALSIATPNHWHAPMTVWACQAGMDVYVEKPVSHSFWEGQEMVKAARRHDRIVQGGTQGRSATAIQDAAQFVREGNLGAVQWCQGLCYKPRKSIGKVTGVQVVPEHIDYDLWTGPAPMKPLARKNLHYDWHWDADTGNGDLGNQGVHQVDICRWFSGHSDLPPLTVSVGGRVGYRDDANTPNTQVVRWGYETAPILFEVRGLPASKSAQASNWRPMDRHLGHSIGNIIHCEGGTIRLGSNYGTVTVHDPQGVKIKEFAGSGDHFANFIDAVRARDRSVLTADVLQGHLSAALCHLGTISHKMGSPASAQMAKFAMAPDLVGVEAIERCAAHLAANEVTEKLTIGAGVAVDSSTGTIVAPPGAATMAKGLHRSPYTIKG
jgi:predicted dehydrogenase